MSSQDISDGSFHMFVSEKYVEFKKYAHWHEWRTVTKRNMLIFFM